MTNPYETLGLHENFSNLELRTRWKACVKKHHPDRGGSSSDMAKVSEAYDILRSPKRKQLYDKYGEKALGLFKTFDLICKNRLNRPQMNINRTSQAKIRRQNRERSRSPIRKKRKLNFKAILQIKLEEAYNGGTKRVAARFQEDCTKCRKNKKSCPFCNGQGRFIDIDDTRGQNWKDCKHCNATGVQKTSGVDCFICFGKGKYLKKEKLDVVIEPGMRNLQKIVMEMPKMNAGITIQILKNRIFKRVENDLFMTKKITLKESLFGTSIPMETFDHRKLMIKSPKFKTVKPTQAYRIPNEGMPIFRGNGKKGDINIKFVVEFPKRLGPKDAKLFQRLNELVKIPSHLDITGPADYSDENEETLPHTPLKSETVHHNDAMEISQYHKPRQVLIPQKMFLRRK